MSKRRVWIGLSLALTAGLGLFAAGIAQAEISGRWRFERANGTVIEGEVKEEGDVYVVTVRPGIEVKLKKSEVRNKRQIAAPKAADATATAAPDKADERDAVDDGALTDADIKRLLGEDTLGVDAQPDKDVLPALELNQESVDQMRTIAGTTNEPFVTDHFVLVYTSPRDTARTLASRLEAIYRWNHQFARMMKLDVRRPAHKLEVFFFGDHAEFTSYSANQGFQGGISLLGFYSGDTNRSAFFEMDTWPPFARAYENWKQAPPDQKRRLTNWLKRTREFQNMEIVQHEAAHHIQFNMGIFNNEARPPRWLSEGLAMMFELPPGSTGASLGTLNNHRISQFQEMFPSEAARKQFPLKQWILQDQLFFANGGNSYPIGWAITNYLYRKHRDKFSLYMQKIGALDADASGDIVEREKLFEDHFGVVDAKWQKDFFDYNMSLPVVRSQLPPLE